MTFERVSLTIFGVKKVIFGTFSKLFCRCSSCVMVLFLDLTSPFFGRIFKFEMFVYALEVVKFCFLEGVILSNFGIKKVALVDFLKLF